MLRKDKKIKKIFIGIDLAWKDSNCSGACIIKYYAEHSKSRSMPRILEVKDVKTDDEIIMLIKKYVEKEEKRKEIAIAIDAPLIFPEKGTRNVDVLLNSKHFSDFNFKLIPANKEGFLKRYGMLRGRIILEKLKKLGLTLFKDIIEVHPRSSLIIFLDFYKNERLPDYKHGRIEKRAGAFDELVRKLIEKFEIENFYDFFPGSFHGVKAKELKLYENRFDALICALTAWQYCIYPERSLILGDENSGFIVLPLNEKLEKRLRELKI